MGTGQKFVTLQYVIFRCISIFENSLPPKPHPPNCKPQRDCLSWIVSDHQCNNSPLSARTTSPFFSSVFFFFSSSRESFNDLELNQGFILLVGSVHCRIHCLQKAMHKATIPNGFGSFGSWQEFQHFSAQYSSNLQGRRKHLAAPVSQ